MPFVILLRYFIKMPKLKRKIGIRCHMMKKLKILGMELDNYTVWEAMGKVEGFLNTTIMNTVEAVSMEMQIGRAHV